MLDISRKALRAAYHRKSDQLVWEWARDNVDFSREPAYETELKARYDPDYMPLWKEVQECFTDRSVREVFILKSARAGASENVLLNPMRYCVARMPCPILYVSGDENSVARFFERRIKLGLKLSRETTRKLRRARQRENEIFFEDMDLICAWPRSKTAFKQSGYPVIFVDELSTYPGFSLDMIRKRMANFSFGKLYGISSPDPQQKRASKDDPIFIAFNEGDQRYWFMPDPKTGKPFRFEMGRHAGNIRSPGLKWSSKSKRKDGTWDLNKVRESAYYLTPDGTRIENNDRLAVIRSGSWEPTAKRSTKGVRSYHANVFYVPFREGDFGEIAVRFLKAKHNGTHALKTFKYEDLAEPWTETTEALEVSALDRCQRDYIRGQRMFSESEAYAAQYKDAQKAAFCGVDVQKGHLWALCEEYVQGGDAALIDYALLSTWDQVEEFATRCGAVLIGADYGYALRRQEVLEQAVFRKGFIPMRGSERLEITFAANKLDPYEGKRGAGAQTILSYTYHTDPLKSMRMDAIAQIGQRRWYCWKHPEYELVKQITDEEKTDGKWISKTGNNHLWDCSIICQTLAMISGIMRPPTDIQLQQQLKGK